MNKISIISIRNGEVRLGQMFRRVGIGRYFLRVFKIISPGYIFPTTYIIHVQIYIADNYTSNNTAMPVV